MQNDLPMTINRSKSKPEVKFQYGGLPFSETRSSFYLHSALRYCIEIWYAQVPSVNWNTKVDFWFHGRHLEKSIRHNSAVNRPITTKYGKLKQSHMPMTTHIVKNLNQT